LHEKDFLYQFNNSRSPQIKEGVQNIYLIVAYEKMIEQRKIARVLLSQSACWK